MLTVRRVVIATLCGLLFGIVCSTLAGSNPNEEVLWGTLMTILFGRTLMGFTIGISAFKMQWWLHGLILGFVTSIPMVYL